MTRALLPAALCAAALALLAAWLTYLPRHGAHPMNLPFPDRPKIGGLFFGYGGLDMAVQSVLGGDLAWVSEFDKGACKIIAHRHPDVPNLGDITKVDWAAVEPVDILTGGSPCQDLSHAGRRAGMTEGTRSNLWVAMREAIAVLRPRLVVWENVRGAYSAAASSALEPCPGCLGADDGGEPVLRALGRVLGDLSDLGYDARWHGLRAADVGAPHGRFRVFVAAYPQHDGPPVGAVRRGGPRPSEVEGRVREPQGSPADPRLLPTPTTDDAGNLTRDSGEFQSLTRTVVNLLPTPAVNDMGEGKTVAWDAWTDAMKSKHGNGNGHGASLAIEAQRLLPTPTTTQRGTDANLATRPDAGPNLHNAVAPETWGQYADAITRWQQLTRPAPDPTEVGPKGSPQLSPRFSEWMMGLPDGWVTDVPGIARNEALKACGNGVVPQQAATALRLMLADEAGAA